MLRRALAAWFETKLSLLVIAERDERHSNAFPFLELIDESGSEEPLGVGYGFDVTHTDSVTGFDTSKDILIDKTRRYRLVLNAAKSKTSSAERIVDTMEDALLVIMREYQYKDRFLLTVTDPISSEEHFIAYINMANVKNEGRREDEEPVVYKKEFTFDVVERDSYSEDIDHVFKKFEYEHEVL